MGNFPPWWKGPELHCSEIELVDFDPPEQNDLPVAQAEEIVEDDAQQVHAVQNNNMDITEIGVVVGMLLPVLILLLVFLSMNGFGSPYRGGSFRDGSANLRDGAIGKLRGAGPIEWSGAPQGAADNYAGKVGDQQAHAATIMDADRQIADTLETQADQVEQGRWVLEAAIFALLGGITVAELMEVRWKAAVAAGSPTAPALWAVLVIFARSLAGTTAAAALGGLFFQVAVGAQNAMDFSKATDQYKQVVHDVAAKMPSGEVPAVAVPAMSGATAASFSDTEMGALIDGLFRSDPALPETVETLGELAELCRQATKFSRGTCTSSTSEKTGGNQLVGRIQWLAAMAQRAAPAATEEGATLAEDSRGETLGERATLTEAVADGAPYARPAIPG